MKVEPTWEEVNEIERKREERFAELETFFGPGCSAIYMIKNKVNNKRYIGKAKNFSYRIESHKKALINGKHVNVDLQSDFDKYGISNFKVEMLERVENESELNTKERKRIFECDSKLLYNVQLNRKKHRL